MKVRVHRRVARLPLTHLLDLPALRNNTEKAVKDAAKQKRTEKRDNAVEIPSVLNDDDYDLKHKPLRPPKHKRSKLVNINGALYDYDTGFIIKPSGEAGRGTEEGATHVGYSVRAAMGIPKPLSKTDGFTEYASELSKKKAAQFRLWKVSLLYFCVERPDVFPLLETS